MKLEICIPTYNRPAFLRTTVQRLLPQLVEGVGIRILDNHSSVPVSYESLGLNQPEDNRRVQIERNSVNIGGDANIARCFQQCQGEYMWLLGDDDVLSEKAIQTILNDINVQSDAIFFNYCLPGLARTKPTKGAGLDALLESADRWGNFMLISNDVYRVRDFHAYVQVGFRFGYSQASHMAILIEMLRVSSGKFMLSDKSIVLSNAPNSEGGWSLTRHGLARMSLLDLKLTRKQRARLKALIVGEVQLFNHAIIHLLGIAHEDPAGARFFLRKIYYENFSEPFGITRWLRYQFCMLAFRIPRISTNILRSVGLSARLDTIWKRETVRFD